MHHTYHLPFPLHSPLLLSAEQLISYSSSLWPLFLPPNSGSCSCTSVEVHDSLTKGFDSRSAAQAGTRSSVHENAALILEALMKCPLEARVRTATHCKALAVCAYSLKGEQRGNMLPALRSHMMCGDLSLVVSNDVCVCVFVSYELGVVYRIEKLK